MDNPPCVNRRRWWMIKTTRWGGSTWESAFWIVRRWPTHVFNVFTRIRGWYWVKKGY